VPCDLVVAQLAIESDERVLDPRRADGGRKGGEVAGEGGEDAAQRPVALAGTDTVEADRSPREARLLDGEPLGCQGPT
jgi:hypothetical protein